MLENFIGAVGEGKVLALGGLLIGLIFGALALASRFCLRSAVLEVFHRKSGPNLPVWLLAFSAAIILTQGFILLGVLNVSDARQLTRGGLSGAVIGGLLFGAGMVLTRGCSSRLLVLAGTGNMRAVVSALVFAVVAQATLSGELMPLRMAISGWWPLDEASLAILPEGSGMLNVFALVFGLAWLAGSIFLGLRSKAGWSMMLAGLGIGAIIAAAWLFTYQVSVNSFEVIDLKSLSFTGPAAEVLMLLSSTPGNLWKFDIALVPGVFIGAFLVAAFKGELKLQGFKSAKSVGRYVTGAALMGFGGVMAGGCAVGAGVSGSAIFALTAWVALFAMAAAIGLTDYLVDRRQPAPALALQPTPA